MRQIRWPKDIKSFKMCRGKIAGNFPEPRHTIEKARQDKGRARRYEPSSLSAQMYCSEINNSLSGKLVN